MDFESLIWIIAVLIWAVSAVLKKKRAAPKPEKKAAAKKRPEWREKLDRYLAQIKEEMQDAPDETPAPMEISRDEAEAVGEFPEYFEKPVEREPYYQDIELSADDLSHEALAPEPEAATPIVPGLETETPLQPAAVLEYDIQDLRQAIIWSEILGPPVALKNH